MSSGTFDVLAYSADAHGSHRADLTGLGEPLSHALLTQLRYLRRCLSGTTSWLGLVLVTPTHKNARITAFLSSWAYERLWMADAIDALTGGIPAPSAAHAGIRGLRDRFAPLGEALVANVHGTALSAVHMAERAVDGVFVDALLAQATEQAGAAVAADLDRLRAVLTRQQAFFTEAAGELLTASARARRLAQRRLTARAWPIGAEDDPGGTASALAELVAGDPGWARAADDRIDAIPGLAGLRIAERSAGNPGRPVLRTTLRPVAALGRLVASVIRRKG
ncbi:hypothetical protein [Amnibacterium sp.]|uniref:hypothetical protein n=1 Tax=Amnibacterium sp. TaxID=1872496 RepID=UPI002616B9CF|nr:hypothetical protein [Amnibacterium sp.]MCU1472460.1 hypothetical protein [Amnibacterium sp.]